ncbi:NAD-dependent deacetylase [Massilia aurea]|uniref:protein acetyllysine N-acetyltransferase n=1 Tax=Massilia aurea TaxID=373040 RepID=A0A422QGG8_9BURK|nr:NAD-dependent protein deacetylase [Massilia aurea]RNF29049.1 NAD-dependent deacetylase [Massilia aurea]
MAEGLSIHDGIDAMAAFLARHPRTLVLTGAGLSTASGIPDYRDRDGVRRGRLPIQGPEFRRDVAVQQRYWARSMVGWPLLARARPNDGHRALAALEAAAKLGFILTQNVDGLHQQAGSHALLELHGNIHHVSCLACHARFPRAFVQTQLEFANPALLQAMAAPLPDGDAALDPDAVTGVAIPACVHCGGVLMPDVVFFGDNVPPARTACALAQMEAADALLVVGSSLMVYSGFRFCRLAQAAGKPIAAINLGRTRADDMLSLKLEATAEQILPQVAQLLGANRPAPPSDLIDHRGTM